MVNNLEITHVAVYPISGAEGRLRAIARIVLNNSLQLTNLRIYDGSNGLFVAYPIDSLKKGEEFRQIFYPLARGFREYVEETILAEYDKEVGEESKKAEVKA